MRGTDPPTQRNLEDLLGQQLGEMDASICRKFENLLGQHQRLIETAIGRAHDDAQEQFVERLLDIIAGMRRLEDKLDRIADSLLQRQSSSVQTRDAVQGELQEKLMNNVEFNQQNCNNSKADVETHNKAGAVRSKSLVEIIDKVCAGKGPAGNLVSRHITMQAPASCQVSQDARSNMSGAHFAPRLQVCVQASQQAMPTQLVEQQRTVTPSGLEQQAANEQPVPQAKAELSFRREKIRGMSLLSSSRRESLDVGRKLEALSESLGKKLERIAYVLGIRNLNVADNSADDAEESHQVSKGARSNVLDAHFAPNLQVCVQAYQQAMGTQLAEQQKTVTPPGSEQQVENEQPVPQAKAELSFRREKIRGMSLLHFGGSSRREGLEVDRKLEALSESLGKKLERIAYVLGIRNLNVVDNSADDAEDRKRLMEKLKVAFENHRQEMFRTKISDREIWLDSVFGICKPDKRIGKRGSRYSVSFV